MTLVETWDAIERGLGDDWADARLRLALDDAGTAARATSLLGSVTPARAGGELRLHVARRGAGASPHALRRALDRLDREWIKGELELVASTAAEPAPEPAAAPTLAEGWDALVATLPPDWSDLYVELGLRSSDFLDRASLRMTPLNARRPPDGPPALRFRAARTFGYGASPGMARRCLERCDEDGIRGELRLLRVLSGTIPVWTQGPVWQIAGRTI